MGILRRPEVIILSLSLGFRQTHPLVGIMAKNILKKKKKTGPSRFGTRFGKHHLTT